MIVLSIFPGIGLLDRAFEEEGFCVVRGPDLLWGGDIRTFHPPAGKFDGVIGGVPCQEFSRLAHLARWKGYKPKYGDLFPEYERVVREAEPVWFLCECVPDAPGPAVEGYAVCSFLWGNHWLGEKQTRTRRFWFGTRGAPVDLRRWMPQSALELPTRDGCVTAAHGSQKGMRRYRLPEACALQGLPEDFLAEAPFTAQGKLQVVANGVPLPLGRAMANAVKQALGLTIEVATEKQKDDS